MHQFSKYFSGVPLRFRAFFNDIWRTEFGSRYSSAEVCRQPIIIASDLSSLVTTSTLQWTHKNSHSNGNTAIGTLAVDGWTVTFSTERGPGRATAPPSPLFAAPNVTANPSTASISSYTPKLEV